MKRYDCHVGEYFERPDGEFVLYEDHAKALSVRLQDLEEAREGRAAAIDRLTPLGCENAELRALLTQAPIAKVVVREGCAHYAPDDVSVSLYAPGLPPGEYDLYLMPDVPQTAGQEK